MFCVSVMFIEHSRPLVSLAKGEQVFNYSIRARGMWNSPHKTYVTV